MVLVVLVVLVVGFVDLEQPLQTSKLLLVDWAVMAVVVRLLLKRGSAAASGGTL